MLGAGLLECAEGAAPIPVVRVPEEGLRQRRPPQPPQPVSRDRDPVPTLPRRMPGASGITESLAPEKRGTSWKGFFRMRNGTAK